MSTVPRERQARIEHILDRAVKAEKSAPSMVSGLLAMAERLENMSPEQYALMVAGLAESDEDKRRNRPIGF